MTTTTPASNQTTQAQRLVNIFNNAWPSIRWHLRFEQHGDDRAYVTIMSQDKMTNFASVRMVPKHLPGEVGYNITVTYPGFCGSPEELEESAEVIATLAKVLKRIQKTLLISEGI